MPAGLIEHHDGVFVVADRGREVVEELLHRLGIRIRHHECEGVVGAGLDRGKDVGERKALVAQTRRALTTRPPNVAGSPFLSDARLVLEKEADALIFVRTLNSSQQRRSSF
jgi:hypothetical protein